MYQNLKSLEELMRKGMDVHYLAPSDESLKEAMAEYTRWLDEQISEAQNLLTKPLAKSINSSLTKSVSY